MLPGAPVGATWLPDGAGQEVDDAVAGGSLGMAGSRGNLVTFESFAASAIVNGCFALVVPVPCDRYSSPKGRRTDKSVYYQRRSNQDSDVEDGRGLRRR